MSDDDLIRRGDALDAVYEADSLEMAQFGGNVIADRVVDIPAVTPAVKVKPLVWEDRGNGYHATAYSEYEIRWSQANRAFWVICHRPSRGPKLDAYVSTFEAAKAAAEADHEAHIRSQVDLTPAPTLAEAAKVLADLLANADDAHPQLEQAVQIAAVMRDAEQPEELIAALRRIAEARHD